ncbi:hypothetical protein APHAL10511_003907 [Amanita phalloides]|nr:hypothetical protein APHAL10511_003907 [Amanita phalloides]
MADLIAALAALAARSPRLVKASKYAVSTHPSPVVSWKMNEFKYYDIPSPFPTYARGLFSQDDRIVARGYDKFFNIGEVPWTEWSFLDSHTCPPYTLSLKSNGCIIFIGALDSSSIIVTSKHSVGAVTGQAQSHAQVGETWLRLYLAQKGKTEQELAKTLWDNSWTAISELCDDSFEEHVLPYPPDKRGLYLHGINTCTKEFHTLPPSTVDAFADEWGFIKTKYTTLDSIPQVRAFTDEIRKTGTWQGEPLEGFVVRTHITQPPAGSSSKAGLLPYSPGSTFFFKVKYDEPYLMYRDWREVTKSLLSMKSKSGRMNPSNLPKSKMRRPETKVYVNWVIKEINQNPEAFRHYQNNKGIIKTRGMFLDWLASDEGKNMAEDAKAEVEILPSFDKTIIVPVAVPGSGKTAVSVALAHIFGFGHTQSDNVRTSKKPGQVFVKNVMNLLQSHDVVIADKNNHLRQHRTALREESDKFAKREGQNHKKQTKKNGKKAGEDGEEESEPPMRVRLLALYWDASSQPYTDVFRICAGRVRERGPNHQTLRADPNAPPPSSRQPPHAERGERETYEDVIWQFIRTREELLPSEVDGIIEMQLGEGLEESVRRAVEGVVAELELPMPSEETIQEGIDKVGAYTVKEADKKPDPAEAKQAKEPKGTEKGKKKPHPARYYGFLPELEIEKVLDSAFASADVDAASFWDHLKNRARVVERPHVTIVHKKDVEQEENGDNTTSLWDRCEKIVSGGSGAIWLLHLTNVVWDARVMALVVDGISRNADRDVNGDGEGIVDTFVASLTEDQRYRFHITVATRDAEVKPVEAKALVQAWRRGESNDERRVLSLGPIGVTVAARMSGLQS